MGIATTFTAVAAILALGADAMCMNLPDAIPASPKAIPSDDVLRRQIAASLKLQSIHSVPQTAWKASNWSSFAQAVGTQDFAFQYMACQSDERATPGRFVHFDYGLGDNDFGSVHASSEEQATCRIDDGDWSGVHGHKALCESLEKASDDDVSNDRWAILDIPSVDIEIARTINGMKADNYGADAFFLKFGKYVRFWDTDGSEFLRLTSRTNKTCILYVDGNAAGGRSPEVQKWKEQDASRPLLGCRLKKTLEWQADGHGAWCTRWRLAVAEEAEDEKPLHLLV
jgi:hypothetical protein